MSASPEISRTFQPLFELGRGGVAVVRAEHMLDDDGAAQTVAVKRLLPMVASDADSRKMFLDEARLAAMISHPNVVQVLGFGEQDEPYIAMDLIAGMPLSRLIELAHAREERPLRPELALQILAQVCDALHAAHELRDPTTGAWLGLVHRDVSPHNMLLSFDGRVYLTDFGIAKALGYGARTRTGDVKGKIPYMSPEQAMADEVDQRTDLFAVGAVLYETLAGERMLQGPNEVVLLRHLTTHDASSLRSAWPTAPETAVRWFASLMARDRAQRPATAQQVATTLRELANTPPDRAQDDLAARIAQLDPGAKARWEDKLRGALEEAEHQRPYLQEMEDFAERPSALFRERRRARNMLAVGLGFLLLAVGFVLALALRKPQPQKPLASVRSIPASPTASTKDATVNLTAMLADAAAGAHPVSSGPPRVVPPARPSVHPVAPHQHPPRPPATHRPAATSATPPNKPPAPKDDLDEHPF